MDTVEIKAPQLPESVTDGTVGDWAVEAGQAVSRDDVLVVVETDKVALEIVAPADGVLEQILCQTGDIVGSGEVLGRLRRQVRAGGSSASAAGLQEQVAEAAVAVSAGVAGEEETSRQAPVSLAPAARKLVEEHGLDPGQIPATGKKGRLTKRDVSSYLADLTTALGAKAATSETAASSGDVSMTPGADRRQPAPDSFRAGPATAVERSRRVPMTRMRARIAERMLQATRESAMLTTFNEVDMSQVLALRERHGERFAQAYDVGLGLMSFFVRAVVEGLRRFPVVNACLDGKDVLYHEYQHIGIAVATPNGLVVPVLRDAQALGFAEIERQIAEYATGAKEGSLSLEQISGGTFTITNGGVFGSLLSTPILNPPQTAILGMHAIQDRPVAVAGQVEVRPMMYLALTYDHRLVDGREAVRFLVCIKEQLEDPLRLLLAI